MSKKIIVTTSWDDGHVLDLRLGQLLKRHGIEATFYISPHNSEFKQADFMSKRELTALAQDFEIGAHTMNHVSLTEVSDSIADEEISESKAYLESEVRQQMHSFCYPRGLYAPQHVAMVKKHGFSVARTTQTFKTEIGKNNFEMSTSVHVYNHWTDIIPVAKLVSYDVLKFVNTFRNFEVIGKELFNKVLAQGGVFHLWGHSWEIEKYKQWDRLDALCGYIANRNGVRYCTNGALR